MSMIQPFTIVQENYGETLSFIVVDGQENAVDLTGATIELKVQNAQDASDTLVTLSGSVAIDEATAGKCHYTVAAGDFSTPGKYLGELVITLSGISQISAPGIVINVLPSLPKANN